MSVNCRIILIYRVALTLTVRQNWAEPVPLEIKDLFGGSNGVCDISLTGV